MTDYIRNQVLYAHKMDRSPGEVRDALNITRKQYIEILCEHYQRPVKVSAA